MSKDLPELKLENKTPDEEAIANKEAQEWRTNVENMLRNSNDKLMKAFLCGMEESMDISDGSDAGFINVALFGERLRRRLPIEDSTSPEPNQMLGKYDTFLSNYKGNTPKYNYFTIWMDEVLQNLEQYSKATSVKRGGRKGARLLIELDDVLAAATATARAGFLPKEELKSLSDKATDTISKLTPKLHTVWDYAERREQALAPDPDYPYTYDFWDEMAQFAADRVALTEALPMPGAKATERIVKKTMEAYRASGH